MNYLNTNQKGFRILISLAVLLLFFGNNHRTVSAQNSASGPRITISMQDTPISEILEAITKRYDFAFIMRTDNIDTRKRVSIDVREEQLSDVLKKIFDGQDVAFEFEGKMVQISKAARQTTPAARVKKTVTGVVRDPSGQAIIGASVIEQGSTSNGVLTGLDGTFSIVVYDDSVLEVSYLGMDSFDIKVGAATSYEVVLTESAQAIESVVVTGMSQVDRRLFTGAADRLAADDVMISGMAEISRSLEGRAAGVTVQNVSGTFGAAPKIRIRGATSIYGNSRPLWVVDGVIMEDVVDINADDLASGDVETLLSSAISGLNADDIESFQILKDGSATSIYGARAMAGVIVITTKRGRPGTSSINYTGEFSIRMKPTYREFNVMNSQEQMGVYKELKDKGWLNYSSLRRGSTYGVYGKMYELMSSYDTGSGQYGLVQMEEIYNKYLQEAEMRNTDWFDLLFNNSVTQQHSISFSSGNEKSTSYASLSLYEDPGVTKQSHVRRMTANVNYSHRIRNNLTASIIAGSSYRKQKAPGTQNQSINYTYGEISRNFDINPYSYALNTSRTLDPATYYRKNYAPFNIFEELDNNYMEIKVVDVKFQGELKWKPVKTIELAALGALRYMNTSTEHFVKDNSNQANAYRAMDDDVMRGANGWLYNDPDYPTQLKISVLPYGGFYRRNTNEMTTYDFRATAQWNQVFDNVHIGNLFGGMEIKATDRRMSSFNGVGMMYDKSEIPFYIYQFFKQGTETGSNYYSLSNSVTRNAAFFATGTYSYKHRYTLNGTVRYEGTNRLGRSRKARWLPTWNVSGLWSVHEEDFFSGISHIMSSLSTRVSYSLTADTGPDAASNSVISIYSNVPSRPYAETKETGLRITALENRDLTYEKKYELNVGLDFSFLDNRFNVSMDYYKRDNFDLIGRITTQAIGGFMTKWANFASMRSYGYELSISSGNIVKPDFRWTTDFIFWTGRSKIKTLDTKPNVMELISGQGFAKEGYPERALFSYDFMGLTGQGFPILMERDGPTSGTLWFGRTDTDHLVYEGPSNPTLSGSLGNNFRYKNLHLNVYFTYSFGNKIRLDPAFRNKYNDMVAMPREFMDRWTLLGDENYTNVPVIASSRQVADNSGLSYIYNGYNYSTERIADGGFVRLKEISLTYDFPKKLISNWNIKNLSLKFQVTNLCLLYSDKKLYGQDPEFFRSGGVANPVPRQFTFTLRLGL